MTKARSLTSVGIGVGILLSSAAAWANYPSADYPGWLGRHQAFENCKNAVVNRLGSIQTVKVDDHYWIKDADRGMRLLVNATINPDGETMRASCEIRGGRVADVTTLPGRYISS